MTYQLVLSVNKTTLILSTPHPEKVRTQLWPQEWPLSPDKNSSDLVMLTDSFCCSQAKRCLEKGQWKLIIIWRSCLDCRRPGLEALVKLEFCSAFGKLFLYGCGWSRGMREHAGGRLVIAYSCPLTGSQSAIFLLSSGSRFVIFFTTASILPLPCHRKCDFPYL